MSTALMFTRLKSAAYEAARGALAVALFVAASALPAVADADNTMETARIVSVGGDVTETLYLLGLQDSIEAVDTTSVFPQPDVSRKKSVGYMRALSSEGVLSMAPTLILATGKSGPPEVVAALKASSAPFVEIDGPDTPEGVAEKVLEIAKVVGKEQAGRKLAEKIKADFEDVAEARAKIAEPAKVLFLLSVQSGRALAGGRGTAADAMLTLAGANNVATAFEGYKPLSGEAALLMAPDAIVVMKAAPGSRTADPHGDIANQIAAIEGLADTPAVKNGRIIEFDGSLMLQFGPRAAEAARELMRILHPGVAG